MTINKNLPSNKDLGEETMEFIDIMQDDFNNPEQISEVFTCIFGVDGLII